MESNKHTHCRGLSSGGMEPNQTPCVKESAFGIHTIYLGVMLVFREAILLSGLAKTNLKRSAQTVHSREDGEVSKRVYPKPMVKNQKGKDPLFASLSCGAVILHLLGLDSGFSDPGRKRMPCPGRPNLAGKASEQNGKLVPLTNWGMVVPP